MKFLSQISASGRNPKSRHECGSGNNSTTRNNVASLVNTAAATSTKEKVKRSHKTSSTNNARHNPDSQSHTQAHTQTQTHAHTLCTSPTVLHQAPCTLCSRRTHAHTIRYKISACTLPTIDLGSPPLLCLCPLSPNSSGQLDVLRHDSDTLCMDCAQICVLEQRHEVRLRRLLKRSDCGGLEAEIVLEVLSDLTHQTLERKLAKQQISRLLILANLSQGDSTRSIPVRLLHTSCIGCGLARCLRCQLFAWRLSSCRLTSSLLGTSHDNADKSGR